MNNVSQTDIMSENKMVGFNAACAFMRDSIKELKDGLNKETDTVERTRLEGILTGLQSKEREILDAIRDDLPDYEDDPDNYKIVVFALNRVINDIGDIYLLHKDDTIIEPVKKEPLYPKTVLPTVRPCYPDKLALLNPRITQYIFDPVRCADLIEPIDIGIKKVTSNTKDFKAVKGVQCLQVIDGMNLPANIGVFDKVVLSSICTLYEEFVKSGKSGDMIVTPQMIYQCYAGKPASKKAQIDNVTKSVRKMMTTIVSFDWRDHAVAKKLLSKEDAEILSKSENFIVERQNMIYAREIFAQVNGARLRAFQLFRTPCLYEYSRSVGQIVTIQKNLLQIPDLKNTDEITLMKIYLATRIELMKNKRNSVKSNSILYESITQECQTKDWDSLDKTERKRKRETVSKILDNWKSEHYIKGYAITKKGSTQTGVEIILN